MVFRSAILIHAKAPMVTKATDPSNFKKCPVLYYASGAHSLELSAAIPLAVGSFWRLLDVQLYASSFLRAICLVSGALSEC